MQGGIRCNINNPSGGRQLGAKVSGFGSPVWNQKAQEAATFSLCIKNTCLTRNSLICEMIKYKIQTKMYGSQTRATKRGETLLGTKEQRARQRSACASKYAFNTKLNDLWDNKIHKTLHGAWTRAPKTGNTLFGTKNQRTRQRSACAENQTVPDTAARPI